MGMCAFTCCMPCWCAAGITTATAPLCCCKERYSKAVPARNVQLAVAAFACVLGLALYILMRVWCMENGDCVSVCPDENAVWLGDGPPPPMPEPVTVQITWVNDTTWVSDPDGEFTHEVAPANFTGWELLFCNTTCTDAPFSVWESSACFTLISRMLPSAIAVLSWLWV
jgi:hypothetical protein